MSLDSDFALIGNGLAPLMAATHLLNQGKSVLLLNPDRDYFLEDSELPLDPLCPLEPQTLDPGRMACIAPATALAELRPSFPGPVESWPSSERDRGYRDPNAPHVRQRARLWIRSSEMALSKTWEMIEDMYVESSDAGLNPIILEGLPAAQRFPGFSSRARQLLAGDQNEGFAEVRGVLLPRTSDIDVSRYRNGVLEFVRERLGPDRVACNTSPMELVPEGVRFFSPGGTQTAKLSGGVMVFWTPRLTQWLSHQARELEISPPRPSGVRLWEEWSLISREPLDPGTVGVFEDSVAWAETNGSPSDQDPNQLRRLAVLRPGPLVDAMHAGREASPASSDSFESLWKLCHGFLKWDKFSIRALRTRGVFEWGSDPDALGSTAFRTKKGAVRIVTGSDGPIVRVARAVRMACDEALR